MSGWNDGKDETQAESRNLPCVLAKERPKGYISLQQMSAETVWGWNIRWYMFFHLASGTVWTHKLGFLYQILIDCSEACQRKDWASHKEHCCADMTINVGGPHEFNLKVKWVEHSALENGFMQAHGCEVWCYAYSQVYVLRPRRWQGTFLAQRDGCVYLPMMLRYDNSGTQIVIWIPGEWRAMIAQAIYVALLFVHISLLQSLCTHQLLWLHYFFNYMKLFSLSSVVSIMLKKPTLRWPNISSTSKISPLIAKILPPTRKHSPAYVLSTL